MDRRLRYALIAALAAVALVGTLVVVTRDDGSGPVAVKVAGDGETTTTTTTADTSTSTTSDATTSPPTVSKATTTTTTAAPTPPPAGGAAIHRCAEVAAATASGLSAKVCQEGTSVAGQPTSLHLTASDGDAKVDNDCRSPDFEWGDEPGVRCMIACQMTDGPTGPSSIDITRDHTYSAPGTYHVTVTVESNCGSGPYGESRTLELDLVISKS